MLYDENLVPFCSLETGFFATDAAEGLAETWDVDGLPPRREGALCVYETTFEVIREASQMTEPTSGPNKQQSHTSELAKPHLLPRAHPEILTPKRMSGSKTTRKQHKRVSLRELLPRKLLPGTRRARKPGLQGLKARILAASLQGLGHSLIPDRLCTPHRPLGLRAAVTGEW